ncbi:MAG: ABC transporter ATP-binding protein [Thiobacillaceae bacterium]
MIPALRVQGLRKQFGATRALDDVSLEIGRGEFLGLLGPNGAGKTTLISVMAGLVRADEGEAQVIGHDVRHNYRDARRALGVVPQELVFDPFFTVRETLRLQSGYFGMRNNEAWIGEIMERLDLAQHAAKNMRALSGGMKRRVLVAQALVHKPPVIVLDEPTAGVDVGLRQALWEFIEDLNRQGHTILLTTHYLEEAESLCSRIAMMKAGRIVALDSTQNLLAGASEHRACLQLEGGAPAQDILLSPTTEGGWEFCFRDYSELEQLLTRLRLADIRVKELQLLEADLETVFKDIMGRA